MFGTVYGLFALQIKFVDSIEYQRNVYHLNYIYNWEAEYGYYSLINCDTLGFSCKQIFKSSKDFPKIDKIAQLKTDNNKHELSVIVEDKTLYTQPLD